MTILILGSEGFIGSHLIDHFTALKAKIYGCDMSKTPSRPYTYINVSTSFPELETLFSNTEIDVCINAAGNGSVPFSMTDPLADFEANVLDTIRLLDMMKRLKTSCRYLYISSAAVYGNPREMPVNESAPKNPLSPYGWHKLMGERICKEYHDLYGIRTAILRPFSVYGPRLKKQILWDICEKLKKSNSIELFGTGTESRDFIHVNDLVRLIALLVTKSQFRGEVYNVSSGVETSVKSIADLFTGYYKGKKSITFSGLFRPEDPLNWRADISLITSMGFSTAKNVEEGIVEYIGWYESAHSTV